MVTLGRQTARFDDQAPYGALLFCLQHRSIKFKTDSNRLNHRVKSLVD
jgi:hypothetical protein